MRIINTEQVSAFDTLVEEKQVGESLNDRVMLNVRPAGILMLQCKAASETCQAHLSWQKKKINNSHARRIPI